MGVIAALVLVVAEAVTLAGTQGQQIDVVLWNHPPYAFEEGGVVYGLIPTLINLSILRRCRGRLKPVYHVDTNLTKLSIYAAKSRNNESFKAFVQEYNISSLGTMMIGPLAPARRQDHSLMYVDITFSEGGVLIMHRGRISLMRKIRDALNNSANLLTVVFILSIMFGVVIWIVERWPDKPAFDRSFLKGSWDGFWWSFVTMVTVGYGDKVPRTAIGRIIACIWMLIGVISITVFTSVTTDTIVNFSVDLYHQKICAVNWTREVRQARQLTSHGENTDYIIVKPSFEECLVMVKNGDVLGALFDYNIASKMRSHIHGMNLRITKLFKARYYQKLYFIQTPANEHVVNESLTCLNHDPYTLMTMHDNHIPPIQYTTFEIGNFGDNFTEHPHIATILVGIIVALVLLGFLADLVDGWKTSQQIKTGKSDDKSRKSPAAKMQAVSKSYKQRLREIKEDFIADLREIENEIDQTIHKEENVKLYRTWAQMMHESKYTMYGGDSPSHENQA